jgi:hypothetical protein
LVARFGSSFSSSASSAVSASASVSASFALVAAVFLRLVVERVEVDFVRRVEAGGSEVEAAMDVFV